MMHGQRNIKLYFKVLETYKTTLNYFLMSSLKLVLLLQVLYAFFLHIITFYTWTTLQKKNPPADCYSRNCLWSKKILKHPVSVFHHGRSTRSSLWVYIFTCHIIYIMLMIAMLQAYKNISIILSQLRKRETSVTW